MEQWAIFGVMVVALGLFLCGRWRHDMVALAALLACVVFGLVPADAAFSGFGHPAVVTVACVLILSGALQASGAVDVLARRVLPKTAGPTVTIGALTLLAMVLSAFMNNVGALALLMPVAVQLANRQDLAPGRVLMPVAFGSILGGMTTLIGTPPNLIVSGFRAQSGEPFSMFDFSPVGLAVALTGVVFVILVGWRLVPKRERAGAEGFETGAYLTEVRVLEKAKVAGKSLMEIGKLLEEADAQVVGLVRNDVRIPAPSPYREVHTDDILVVEAEPDALTAALSGLGLKLVEEVPVEPKSEKSAESAGESAKPADGKPPRKSIQSDDVALIELAVLPNATIVGRSATDIRLRSRFGINLLAVSRQGRRSMARLRTMPIRQGDVLLMQGGPDAVAEFAAQFGCVPLAERAVRIPEGRRAVLSVVILAAAVLCTAIGLLPAAVSFAAGVLVAMVLRVVSPRGVYDAVDWPVIVLLAALIPVAGAVETTGAADRLARILLDDLAQGRPILALVLILIATMTLSDFMNNAATAAIMCPLAIGTANQLDVNTDPFLMAVAVGASCAFLTPIGHQNNTLILGPGGFRFGDYWRLGLPLEILVVAVAAPMILWVWPL